MAYMHQVFDPGYGPSYLFSRLYLYVVLHSFVKAKQIFKFGALFCKSLCIQRKKKILIDSELVSLHLALKVYK